MIQNAENIGVHGVSRRRRRGRGILPRTKNRE